MEKRYRKFTVTFVKVYDRNQNYFKDMEKRPAENLTIDIWAPSVEEAIPKAWQTVTVNPSDYEIISIVAPERGYRVTQECEE